MTPFCPADILTHTPILAISDFPRDGEEAGAVRENNNIK